jgi:hypothetical protein
MDIDWTKHSFEQIYELYVSDGKIGFYKRNEFNNSTNVHETPPMCVGWPDMHEPDAVRDAKCKFPRSKYSMNLSSGFVNSGKLQEAYRKWCDDADAYLERFAKDNIKRLPVLGKQGFSTPEHVSLIMKPGFDKEKNCMVVSAPMELNNGAGIRCRNKIIMRAADGKSAFEGELESGDLVSVKLRYTGPVFMTQPKARLMHCYDMIAVQRIGKCVMHVVDIGATISFSDKQNDRWVCFYL